MITEPEAIITNLREGMADAIEALRADQDPFAVANLLESVLGIEGAEHLRGLRQHESLVMALLAYRIGVIESLLPDECPVCHLNNRQHTERCRIGLAITLIPEQMPPIEESASRILAVMRDQLSGWIERIHAGETGIVLVEMQQAISQ